MYMCVWQTHGTNGKKLGSACLATNALLPRNRKKKQSCALNSIPCRISHSVDPVTRNTYLENVWHFSSVNLRGLKVSFSGAMSPSSFHFLNGNLFCWIHRYASWIQDVRFLLWIIFKLMLGKSCLWSWWHLQSKTGYMSSYSYSTNRYHEYMSNVVIEPIELGKM